MSGGFVMVPDWLRQKKPSGTAYQAYVNLGAHGKWNPGTGEYDECRPSMKTLAAEMGVSESTAKRACDELVALKAARKELRFNKDGSPAPSVYQLIFGKVVDPDAAEGRSASEPTLKAGDTGGQEVGPGVDLPRSSHKPKVGPRVNGKQEPSTQRVLIQKDQNPPSPRPHHPPAQRPARSRKPGGESDQLKDQPPDPVDALAVELADKAGWNQRVTAAVLAEQVAENRRPWPVIERVMRRVASDPLTQGPSRIRVVPAQWWMDAAQPERQPKPPWCGECDPVSRQRESATTPGAATRCPACNPQAVSSAA